MNDEDPFVDIINNNRGSRRTFRKRRHIEHDTIFVKETPEYYIRLEREKSKGKYFSVIILLL